MRNRLPRKCGGYWRQCKEQIMAESDLQHEKIEISVQGMDCADCARHVKEAIESVPGVTEVEILFSAQKAAVSLDPEKAGLADIRRAVKDAGYSIMEPEEEVAAKSPFGGKFTRQILTLFGVVLAPSSLRPWSENG